MQEDSIKRLQQQPAHQKAGTPTITSMHITARVLPTSGMPVIQEKQQHERYHENAFREASGSKAVPSARSTATECWKALTHMLK